MGTIGQGATLKKHCPRWEGPLSCSWAQPVRKALFVWLRGPLSVTKWPRVRDPESCLAFQLLQNVLSSWGLLSNHLGRCSYFPWCRPKCVQSCVRDSQSTLLPLCCQGNFGNATWIFHGYLHQIGFFFPLLFLTHHSCNKYLLSNCYNPRTMIGTWKTKMNKV